MSDVCLKLKNVIIVRNTAPQQLKLKQLRSLNVEVVGGHAVQDFLHERELTVGTVPNFRAGLRRVSFGDSDAMVGDLAAAAYLIGRERITNLQIAGDVGYDYQLALAFRDVRAGFAGHPLDRRTGQVTRTQCGWPSDAGRVAASPGVSGIHTAISPAAR